ncbi:type III-B CRISPR module RAMP protein Cmr1 [Desulfosarcina sp. OttesenSCG-928-A07]|nr:type III-B CRISPR module RAMP protein Cmr1 [Desulfosarcina sp. OttesenSCG-928-G17]MDL2330005.1 type III-B CRISPR module RAMP protein Cmr1 [Desulfosarcina sp. OttesenSCG-928-A07]
MDILETRFRIVTPLFMGGASPGTTAELREPSIKGVLRYWYRAIDPEYKKHEARIFGGAGKGQGQSSFLLRIDRFQNTVTMKPHTAINNKGLTYFMFPFTLEGGRRSYLEPNAMVRLQFVFKETLTPEDQQRILAAIWLMGHIGGLGTRSRRGFGSFSLQSWQVNNEAWQTMKELPILSNSETPTTWKKQFENGLNTLKKWFYAGNADAGQRICTHAVLGKNTVFKLLTKKFTTWNDCLARVAKDMQKFRKENTGSGEPFGLPWGSSDERSASRIHVRILNLNPKYYALVFRMDGPLRKDAEQDDTILENYMNNLPKSSLEVKW